MAEGGGMMVMGGRGKGKSKGGKKGGSARKAVKKGRGRR